MKWPGLYPVLALTVASALVLDIALHLLLLLLLLLLGMPEATNTSFLPNQSSRRPLRLL